MSLWFHSLDLHSPCDLDWGGRDPVRCHNGLWPSKAQPYTNMILFFNIYFPSKLKYNLPFSSWGGWWWKKDIGKPIGTDLVQWETSTSGQALLQILVLGLCFERRARRGPSSVAGPLACFCTFLTIYPHFRSPPIQSLKIHCCSTYMWTKFLFLLHSLAKIMEGAHFTYKKKRKVNTIAKIYTVVEKQSSIKGKKQKHSPLPPRNIDSLSPEISFFHI